MLKAWCCWGTDYCKCSCLGLSRNQNVKLTYISIIIISYLFSTLFANLIDLSLPGAHDTLQRMGCLVVYPEGNVNTCYWQQFLFRVSLVIAIMHIVLFFLMLLRNETSKISNEGAWLLKVFLISLFSFILIKLIPSSVTHSIHEVTHFLAGLWFIFQNLIIIDFIFTVDSIITSYSQQYQKLHICKAIFSFIFTGIAIYLNVITYLQIQQNMSHVIPIINSIVLLIGFLVVFLRIFKGNTLLVFGLAVLYANLQGYLIAVHESNSKQSQYISGVQCIFQLLIIIFCLLFMLCAGSNKIRTKKSTFNEILALNTSKEEEDIRYVSSNKWIVFHYILFVICLILPTIIMLNTGFTAQSEQKYRQTESMFDSFRIANWALILIVYGWALIASRLYPQQDFSQMEKYFKEYELN